MCELCRKTPCDTRCPNYVSPSTEYYCSICNEGIYTGEEYIKNDNGDYVHYECISGIRDPFFTKVLGKTQLKRDLQKDIIREVIMLTETNAENDFTSFKSKDIDSFLIWYQDYINEDKIDLVKQSLDKLDESFEELKINVLSIPMIIFAGYRTLKDKKSFASLVDKINDFVANYDTNEEYKQYCQGGTTAQVNVRGRLDYWRNILRTM